jgi:hypothetical protein
MKASNEDLHSTMRRFIPVTNLILPIDAKNHETLKHHPGSLVFFTKPTLQSETIYIVFMTLCVTLVTQAIEHENFSRLSSPTTGKGLCPDGG